MADQVDALAEVRRAAAALRQDVFGTALGRMHPRLALELVSLLDDAGDDIEADGGVVVSSGGEHALNVARLVNGGAS